MKSIWYLLIVSVVGMFMFGCGSKDVSINGIEQDKVAVVDEAHTWTHGDWSSRVLYEARYALSAANHDGTSNNPHNTNSVIYGDSDYVTGAIIGDALAHNRASAEAGNVVGTVGQDGDYFQGGWCTYFVRLVLYRATYWNFSDHYTTPNYGNHGSMYDLPTYWGTMVSSPSNWQGGWVLRGNGHFAIAEQRAYVNGSWGWWIIDSNFVGSYTGYNSYRIGKHFLTDSQLSSGGYYGWQPAAGSDNW